MKAVVVREWTNPPSFNVEEIADAVAGPGEVLIAVDTAGVVFGDTLIASGIYQVRPKLPFTPGSECAGIVEAVGAGVTEYRPGDRVAALGFIGDSRQSQRILGAFAEKIVAPLRNVQAIPDTILSLETAALFRSNTESSYYALQRGHLRAGEIMLVLGAGGGTGVAAIELGKMLGARVIGSASSAEKREIARNAGADDVIDTNDPNWRSKVNELTDGRGVDVVFDPLGADRTERAFRALAYGGRLLVVGFAAGHIPKLPTNLALMKGASLVGANMLRGWEMEPELVAANARALMTWFGEGKLSVPPVARRYPLAKAGEALADVAGGRTAGRVVVSIAPHVDT
jgi:NADPH2:quinone reductase